MNYKARAKSMIDKRIGKRIKMTHGNGIHFCERLEDTLRYFCDEEDVEFAEVTALGEFAEYHDHYNGFYNMYSTNKLRIDRVLSREEVINMFLEMDGHNNPRLARFIMLYPLTEEEISLFKEKFINEKHVIDVIHYYQEKGTFEKQYIK